MIVYDLVQPRGWTGNPSQYPEVHARPAQRYGRQHPSLCGLKAADLRPVPCDPYHALVDQVTCKRCARALERARTTP